MRQLVLGVTYLFMVILTAGCAANGVGSGHLTKLRPIDAPVDIAYNTTIASLEALELPVQQKERSAGRVTARSSEGRPDWAWISIWTLLLTEDELEIVTVSLIPSRIKQTNITIKITDEDGEVKEDQELVDKI